MHNNSYIAFHGNVVDRIIRLKNKPEDVLARAKNFANRTRDAVAVVLEHTLNLIIGAYRLKLIFDNL